jgi:RNA polymerase sigma factor (sigma-70 family)
VRLSDKTLEELIERWQVTRDPTHFGEILVYLRPLISPIFLAYVSWSDASDLLQEYCLRLWRMSATIKPTSHRIPWFIRVAIGMRVDRFRRVRTERKHVCTWHEGEATVEQVADCCDVLADLVADQEANAIAELVQGWLDALKPEDRELLLIWVMDKNEAETRASAAAALNMSKRSFRRKYAELLVRLRRMARADIEAKRLKYGTR